MLSNMISRLVILLFGTLYPAFASYKAVKTKDIKEYVKWMMYWIVFAFFTCLETVTDLFLAWFPFYYEVKILLVLWLLSPVTRGSSILYKKFVHPWLERNENEIEHYIERASQQGYSTVMTLGVRGVNMATQMIMQTAIRGGGGIVDHLRRSYSVNDVTDLAAGTDAGDFNSNRVKRLPQIVDVTEEMDSDADPATFPMAGPSAAAAPVEAAAEPKRRARRAATKPAPRTRATKKTRPVELEESDEREERAPPPAWEQAQSMEDISSGYNSGEPFFDAVAREEDEDVTWPGRRAGSTRAARARPPLHAPRPSSRVKSSATTDVSGLGVMPSFPPLRPAGALLRRCFSGPSHLGPFADYVQGQSPAPKVREYFYYVDHQGMLFLDNAKMKNFTSCIKEQKFLRFFFNQLRFNDTERYPEFPFVSPCGRERNFIRCDDLPVVFTHVLAPSEPSAKLNLSYNHSGALLSTPFEPRRLCMLPLTGRVYHPGPARAGGVGLVRSALAIEFSRGFRFDEGEHRPPTHFQWEGETHRLTNELVPLLEQMRRRCGMDTHPSDA